MTLPNATIRAMLRDRAGVLAVWLMCFAPLAWIPGVANMWIFGKALMVAVAILVGVLAGVRGGIPRSLLILGLCGAAVFVVAAVHGNHPLASLMGRYPRYEGLPILALYAGTLWLGTTASPGSEARRALPDAMASSMLALGAATLAELLGHNPLRLDAVRSGSLLGNATDQGLVAMMATLLLAVPAVQRRDPLLAAGATASVFILAASGSRAAMLGLVAAGLAVLVMRGRGTAMAAAMATLACLGVGLMVPVTRARFTDGASLHARFEIWAMSKDLFARHVFWGVGPSGYLDRIGSVETLAWAHGAGRGNAILDSPHSWVLTFAIDAGVVGLAVALALVVVVLRECWRAARRPSADDLTVGLVAAVIGYGVGLLVNFTIIGSTAPAAYLLGVLVAPAAVAMRRAVATVARVLAAIALVGSVSATMAEVEFTRGVRIAQSGDIHRGAHLVATARHLRPGDVDVDDLAADLLATSTAPGAHAVVEGWVAESQRATPGTYRSAMAAAVSDIAAGSSEDAVRRLDAVVSEYPMRALPLVQRAVAELRLSRPGRAKSDLLAARRLAPLDPNITPLLAQAER